MSETGLLMLTGACIAWVSVVVGAFIFMVVDARRFKKK